MWLTWLKQFLPISDAFSEFNESLEKHFQSLALNKKTAFCTNERFVCFACLQFKLVEI